MKKVLLLVVVVVSFLLVLANSSQAVESTGLSLDMFQCKSISVRVVLKEEPVQLLDGVRLAAPLSQCLVGQNGKLVNITGKTIQEVFMTALNIHGLKMEGELKLLTRFVVDANTLVYVFDYQ